MPLGELELIKRCSIVGPTGLNFFPTTSLEKDVSERLWDSFKQVTSTFHQCPCRRLAVARRAFESAARKGCARGARTYHCHRPFL